jgi:hypothetical protein
MAKVAAYNLNISLNENLETEPNKVIKTFTVS